ncbi:MAG: type IVB secretion system protein IcmH/DotU [Sedimenticola sp.]
MSTDDFFGGGGEDRTVMRPRPGRRRGNQTQSSTVQGTPQTTSPPASAPPLDSAFSFDMPERTPPVQPLGANFATPSPAVAPAQPLPGFGQPQAAVTQAMEIAGIGGNPIVSSATSLLALAGQVRGSISHPDVEGLRARVISEIKNFDVSCRSAGVSQDAQVAARYSLCTFLDEVVLGTPWGGDSGWSVSSLLSTFHNETWGGEVFFGILEKLLQEPAKNHQFLEFMYLLLALGFEGKYGGGANEGKAQLDSIRSNLFQTIRNMIGDYQRELSPQWHGVDDQQNRLVRRLPLWVVGSAAASLLIGAFLVFRYLLGEATYPVFDTMGQIGRYQIQLPTAEIRAAVVPTVRLRDLLAEDITAGNITLEELQGQEIVRIQGDQLFRSGKVSIERAHHALLERLGNALDLTAGQILVIGHSDNIPIRSLRFNSNWDLSRARAVSVVDVLTQKIQAPTRLIPEGLADTEPLVPNDSPANRAKNRRVEIVLVTI